MHKKRNVYRKITTTLVRIRVICTKCLITEQIEVQNIKKYKELPVYQQGFNTGKFTATVKQEQRGFMKCMTQQ